MFTRLLVKSAAILVISNLAVWAQSTDGATDTAQVTQEALSAEETAWNALGDDATSSDLFGFLATYPDGARSADARRRLLELLGADTADADTQAAEQTETDESPAEPTTTVFFDQPLEQGDVGVIGETLEKLIKGNPLHPPVEGLPEEYWKAEECSSCHNWERDNLCEQANFYLREDGEENLTKKHPYGGTFKMNLQLWASDGCQ